MRTEQIFETNHLENCFQNTLSETNIAPENGGVQ